MGLVAPQHVGSSWTRGRTRVPCIGRWILNHCTQATGTQSLSLFLPFPDLCPGFAGQVVGPSSIPSLHGTVHFGPSPSIPTSLLTTQYIPAPPLRGLQKAYIGSLIPILVLPSSLTSWFRRIWNSLCFFLVHCMHQSVKPAVDNTHHILSFLFTIVQGSLPPSCFPTFLPTSLTLY